MSSRIDREVLKANAGLGASPERVLEHAKYRYRLDALRREVSEFRQTMRADFAELRQEMNAKFAAIDTRFVAIDSKFAAMESAAERRHADFMKWTMGFWALSLVTYVGAVVALAKVLR